MRPYHEVRHYAAGDRVVVVDEWRPWDEEHGIRKGETYTCLGVSADGFTAIDNGTCVENGKIVDGYYYERFDRTGGFLELSTETFQTAQKEWPLPGDFQFFPDVGVCIAQGSYRQDDKWFTTWRPATVDEIYRNAS